MSTAPKLQRARHGRLGHADHGLPLTVAEFFREDFKEGYQYELLDGKLYATPLPDPPENCVDTWLFGKVLAYSQEHPDQINYVTNKGRVFVPGRPGATCPEPDLTAYRDFPLHLPFRRIRWQETSPILVGEVLSLNDPAKDLVRNVELYLQVPSIREYWLFDTRRDPEHPTLRVHRRWGRRWRIIDLEPGETYTTKLLPGFELLIDPRN